VCDKDLYSWGARVYVEGHLTVLEQPEVARRIRAALAYGDIGRVQAAELLGASQSTLARYISGRTHYKPDLQLLWGLADACGLPREWFVADLSRLVEIVPAGLPVFSRPRAADLSEGPPGELGRIARGEQTTAPSHPQSGSARDTDARQGNG
jgi:transcriptional regulator with XRE-family HTH domain